MFRKCILLSIYFMLISYSFGSGVKMRRTIQGVGEWYYKILMSLGTCKELLLFSEQQIWGRVRMNRIFDIYYESADASLKVSRVEIKLIVNESDVMGFSDEGVGQVKFSATVYIPVNTFVIFYSLKIFTCNVPAFQKGNNEESNDTDLALLSMMKLNKKL